MNAKLKIKSNYRKLRTCEIYKKKDLCAYVDKRGIKWLPVAPTSVGRRTTEKGTTVIRKCSIRKNKVFNGFKRVVAYVRA